MKKGELKNEKRMGAYELEQGYASYKTIVDYYIGDIVLCNNIIDVDYDIIDNIDIIDIIDINEEYEEIGNLEIFQYYLCNLSDWEREQAKKCGLILSYSDVLNCDVLCVDHWGTSWEYVLTDVKLFDTYEELQKYESED